MARGPFLRLADRTTLLSALSGTPSDVFIETHFYPFVLDLIEAQPDRMVNDGRLAVLMYDAVRMLRSAITVTVEMAELLATFIPKFMVAMSDVSTFVPGLTDGDGADQEMSKFILVAEAIRIFKRLY